MPKIAVLHEILGNQENREPFKNMKKKLLQHVSKIQLVRYYIDTDFSKIITFGNFIVFQGSTKAFEDPLQKRL